MRKFLTVKQRAVFNFVRQRIHNSFPPSVREVAAHIGVTEKAAYDHLWAIRKKGYLHWEDNKARTLSLLPPDTDDTCSLFLVKKDIPELNIREGDFLHIDTVPPVTEGEVILSTHGEIKRFSTGDVAFGKVIGCSRTIKDLA